MKEVSFSLRRKLPVLLQTETAECGLACLAMVASFHGYQVDVAQLRKRFAGSRRGATLASMIRMAGKLELAARALKLELEHLDKLQTPCILHWNLNHFVVLVSVGRQWITIHDPATGLRRLTMPEVSRCFTGVALELWPAPGFKPADLTQRIGLRDLCGRVSGLYRSVGQVLTLALALEVFVIASPFYLQWVVDHALVSADRDLLATLALGFGLLALTQHLIGLARGWVILHMGTTLNLQWRANVFTHLLNLPMTYFETRHLGDVVSRVSTVDVIQRTLTTSFLEALLDGLMTVTVLVLMFVYSPILTWIALSTMALYLLGRFCWYGALRHATQEQIVHAARQQTSFLETVRGIKTIKLFQRQHERRSTWLSLLVQQINADVRRQRIELLMRTLNGLLFGMATVLIVYVGARQVMQGGFTVGLLIAFSAYKTQFDSRVAALIDKFVEIKMLQLHGERLADVVLEKTESTAGQRDGLHEASVAPSITVRNARFRYGEDEPYVLDGLSLHIRAGESVAIAGESGCGKTTLLHVLLGIFPLTEGELLIGDVNIRQLGLEALRGMVGTVLQDDVLFAGSIADNISFFDAHPDQAWIEECARMAAVHEDIMAMPMTYNTLVGDMGTVLSGGQKQRVLLARALYKRPAILFLDEATSHLDIGHEQAVNAAVRQLRITRVMVAHRIETLRTADRVIYLAHGRVAADAG